MVPIPQWNKQRDGSWDKWDQKVAKYNAAKSKSTNRQKKAVFRGAFRQSVLQLQENNLHFTDITRENWREYGRTKLLHLKSLYPDLYDIGLTTSSSEEWRFITGQIGRLNNGTKLSMEEQASNFSFIINVEGACGWADRLKTLMALGAAVLKQDTVCHEFFEPLMKPWIHYVPIDNQLSNLTEQLEGWMNDREMVNFVESNAKTFSNEFLCTEAWEYYFARLIEKYSKLWPKYGGGGGGKMSRRPGSKSWMNQTR